MTVKNVKEEPKIYYGLHMVEGVAEYSEPQVNNGEPYRIYLGEKVIKEMDLTFKGKPVYVHHVDKVDMENLQQEADGYVIRSFYNKWDGKHWAEFIVIGDAAHEAIQRHWKLSNAYIPKEFGGGGACHAVEYTKEVLRGEYEHLAIVPNPRYEESIILTPEEFKAYNSERELELLKIANSKEEKRSMLKFFKKTKIDNAADLEETVVALKSGTEKSIKELIADAEKFENMDHTKVNMDSKIKVGNDEMTINDLVEKYKEMKKKDDDDGDDDESMDNDESEDEEKKKEKHENDESEDEEKKEKKEKKEKHENDESEDEEKKEKKEDKKKNSKIVVDEEFEESEDHFEKMKNAHLRGEPPMKSTQMVETSKDRVARGRARYGS